METAHNPRRATRFKHLRAVIEEGPKGLDPVAAAQYRIWAQGTLLCKLRNLVADIKPSHVAKAKGLTDA